MRNKRIYMDYAASTPMDAAVERAMRPFYTDIFCNPASSHYGGQEASRAVFLARQGIAAALHADYQQIIFTGSATEANNFAIKGAFERALLKKGDSKRALRVIVSAIEHESVYETCKDLQVRYGADVVEIPVNSEGIINSAQLAAALSNETVLVSIQMVNSETGVVQPIEEIGAVIRAWKEKNSSGEYPLFHTDAVQAFQYMPCLPELYGVDMLTVSGHKIYGPKGIGFLYVRNSELLEPQVLGGGQERGMRSGTENVPAIVGFAKAVEMVEKNRKKESARITKLRDALWAGILKIIPDAELNGSVSHRAPHIISVYVPGRPAQDTCIELDLMGVAVSPGTACSSRAAESSRVIKALGFSGDRPLSSIRFSLGRGTKPYDIRAVLKILKKRFGK